MRQKPKAERLVTASEYAKHRGKSRQYIHKLVKSGVLITRADKIAVELSDAVLDDRAQVTPVQSTSAGNGSSATDPGESRTEAPTYADARRDREVYTGRLRKLEFEQKSGALIPVEAVTTRWTAIAQVIKGKLESIPSKLAPQCAALSDVRQVRDTIAKEIAGVLKEIAMEVRYAE